MAEQGNKYNLTTFFFLYIAQSIPMSFLSTVLPVMMRQENFSLSAIGLLQLIKLPWIIKFLWSPIVDKRCVTTKDYKLWIISSEIIYAVLIMAVAFLDFNADFNTMIVLILAAFIASATQDIATDAFAVLTFSRKDKSMLNSMQAMGSFGGSLVGGGLLLLLFQQIGWDYILPGLSLFAVIALLPLLLNRKMEIQQQPMDSSPAKMADILSFFTQKGIWRQIVFLFLFYSGLMGTLAMMKPYLVDKGYNIGEIGIMNGIAGTLAGFLFSFAGGVIIKKVGRRIARILFAVVILITSLFFVGLSQVEPTTMRLYIGIALLWGSYGMATVIVYTTSMDNVRTGREGTDFTLQSVITHISSMIVVVVGGKVADITGYEGLFFFQTILAVVSLLYVLITFRNKSIKI
jgi:Arabinose efflux permease